MSKSYSIVGQKHLGFDPYLVGILPGAEVVLVREPTNGFDPNAVQVWIGGQHVGYLPKSQIVELAAFIDQNGHDIPATEAEIMAADSAGTHLSIRKGINAKFIRSPNSAYPMCEVE